MNKYYELDENLVGKKINIIIGKRREIMDVEKIEKLQRLYEFLESENMFITGCGCCENAYIVDKETGKDIASDIKSNEDLKIWIKILKDKINASRE